MKILTLRTDKPEAELTLFDGHTQIDVYRWQAHRQLAETIHLKIKDLLADNQIELANLDGIVVYAGPGSFTGLRIGMSVANALAYSYHIPVVAAAGNDWALQGIEHLGSAQPNKWVTPAYGHAANITKPKK